MKEGIIPVMKTMTLRMTSFITTHKTKCRKKQMVLHQLHRLTTQLETMDNSPHGEDDDYEQAGPGVEASLDSTSQTGNANEGDWQEVYQKIKALKHMYLPELTEMYQKIATRLQQLDSLPQQPKLEQLDRFKMFKAVLERIMAFLQVSKSNILPNCKEKLVFYEKQILNFVNANRPWKPVSSLQQGQQGQLPQSHMHSMQQPQPQVTQMQAHESQMNPQLQSMSLQGSVATMQQNNMTSLQHNSTSCLSGVSTTQQNLMNSLQPGTNLDSGQGYNEPVIQLMIKKRKKICESELKH